ncbi:MAG: sigma-54 dependent transcriptional regulator [Desulfovibrionales bacterium]
MSSAENNARPNILITDDDFSLREVLDISLTNTGYNVFAAADTEQSLKFLSSERINLVLLDLKLGNENGLDLLRLIRSQYSDIPVLMITAFSETESAVEAMKLGASDFISKPFDLDNFLQIVQHTLETDDAGEKIPYLTARERGYFGNIIGGSNCMQKVFKMVKRVAKTNINILIGGESGTGKELIARAIHNESDRSEQPFVPINCGGIPETLFESELFGYKKGAFTGADKSKQGYLDLADKGTLFLDEVAELAPHSQVKLLRCLQERTYAPLGSTLEKTVSARFIAATNKKMQDMQGAQFREDLFYRLSGVIINIPPLRDRGEDIMHIASYFLEKASLRQEKNIHGFSDEAAQKLMSFSFPGNVRELENLIERAVALEQGELITPDSVIIYETRQSIFSALDLDAKKVINGELSLDEYLLHKEKCILEQALEKTAGQKTEAARLIGLNLRKLRYRLQKVGLDAQ